VGRHQLVKQRRFTPLLDQLMSAHESTLRGLDP